MAVVPSPGVRVTITESLIQDIGRVIEWKTMIVSRSRKMHPQSTPVTIGGTVLKETADLVILGVTFDSKMTFREASSLGFQSSFSRLGI